MKTISRLILFGLIVIALSSCSFVIGTDEPISIYQADTEPKVETISTKINDSGLGTYECIKDLKQRELNLNSKKRTLSSSELDQYLSIMGIKSLCIPSTLGVPFINADWDTANLTADNGRMISLGFENIYNGSGWSEGFILYSTYNFSAGTEYETFADQSDHEAIRSSQIENQIVIDNSYGFVRFMRSSYCFGKCTAYKAFVFPFESYYIAVVYNLGSYDSDSDWKAIFNNFKEGNYPVEKQIGIAEFDFLASSIQFSNEEFSIYLLDEDISAIEFSKVYIEEVILENTPIISGKDIVSYELNSHSIMLTSAAYRRLQRAFPKPVQVSGIPFVVYVGSQRIYTGALWTPVSSISYDGVIILQSFETNGTTIRLTLGYPSSDVFTGRDPRSDPRIVGALERADRLKSVTE